MPMTMSGLKQGALTAAALAAPLAAIFVVGSVAPARAGIEYPWCAVYSERSVGATNCGFSTFAQCAATVHGIGGMCMENPRYLPPAPTSRKPRKPRRY